MAGPSDYDHDPVNDLVTIEGARFVMGSDAFYPEERPVHPAEVATFAIDRFAVTNRQFSAFVDATDYVTVAERPLRPEDYPGVDPSLLVSGGLVFQRAAGPVDLRDFRHWWAYVADANWRQPRGPGGVAAGDLPNHPVVQVAFEDAEAYAAWRGASLPTEAEWELAARGGLDGAAYTWGDEDPSASSPLANTWQGEFPWQNLLVDGFEDTAPVGSFAPNGFGLHDMAGNVWEWTTDWWSENHRLRAGAALGSTGGAPGLTLTQGHGGGSCCGPTKEELTVSDGVTVSDGADSAAPGETFARRVIKGGSHLCAPNYCLRYRPAARQPEAVDTSTCHLGFRCIVRH